MWVVLRVISVILRAVTYKNFVSRHFFCFVDILNKIAYNINIERFWHTENRHCCIFE